VRLRVCTSLTAFPHYCTDPDVTWRSGRGCSVVVHYCADLQSVHGFRCYDKTHVCKLSLIGLHCSLQTRIVPNAKYQLVIVFVLYLVVIVMLL